MKNKLRRATLVLSAAVVIGIAGYTYHSAQELNAKWPDGRPDYDTAECLNAPDDPPSTPNDGFSAAWHRCEANALKAGTAARREYDRDIEAISWRNAAIHTGVALATS
jgi:hypothetical protein